MQTLTVFKILKSFFNISSLLYTVNYFYNNYNINNIFNLKTSLFTVNIFKH